MKNKDDDGDSNNVGSENETTYWEREERISRRVTITFVLITTIVIIVVGVLERYFH